MNDWLDYKGSGSTRSTISHGAYIRSNSKIDSFSGSNLQKTALRNKLDSMTNKFNSAIPDQTRLSTDISLDTFNSMIDELNQNSKTNRR